jgi:hypothetical protein
MGGFKFTELEADEKVVFGPVTSTRTASFSGGTGPSQSSVSRASGRTVGVTNQRVIMEDLDSPDKTKIVPNADVKQVFIKHKQRGGRPTITLSKVQTASGQDIKLNIQGLPGQAETALKSTFPNAEIALEKGMGCPLTAAIPVGLVLMAGALFAAVSLLFGALGG